MPIEDVVAEGPTLRLLTNQFAANDEGVG